MIPGILAAATLRNSVPSPSDPHSASVVSLCSFDGPTGSALFLDSVPNRSWAAQGLNVALSDQNPKFGPTSCLFTGAGGLFSDTAAELGFGAGDYTVEMWIRRAVAGGLRQIFDGRQTGNTGGTGLSLYFTGAGALVTQAASNITSSEQFGLDIWYHLAVSRSTGVLRTFVDGIKRAEQVDTRAYTGGQRIFLGQTYTQAQRFVGNIDEFRVTNGVARYTADFERPAGPFPVPGVVGAAMGIV